MYIALRDLVQKQEKCQSQTSAGLWAPDSREMRLLAWAILMRTKCKMPFPIAVSFNSVRKRHHSPLHST